MPNSMPSNTFIHICINALTGLRHQQICDDVINRTNPPITKCPISTSAICAAARNAMSLLDWKRPFYASRVDNLKRWDPNRSGGGRN
eukprot:scaffold80804_cov48-Attheya_sp.AAC.1